VVERIVGRRARSKKTGERPSELEQQYAQVLQREQQKQEESKRSGFDPEAFIKGEYNKNPFLEDSQQQQNLQERILKDLQERFLKDLEQSPTPTPAKTRIPSPNQR
jgi:hypothetical protein